MDGLCSRYGLYLTSIVDPDVLGPLGSRDLHNILHQKLEATPGFGLNLLLDPDPTNPSIPVLRNRLIAKRYFESVLLARIMIFNTYRRLVHSSWRSSESKRRWLMLQLLPSILGKQDIFAGLTMLLHSKCSDATREVLMSQELEVMVANLRTGPKHSPKMYCVLDEAQHASALFLEAFPSRTRNNTHRPVITEIIATWQNMSATTVAESSLVFVVTGTGLDLPTMASALATATHKIGRFVEYHNTGGFDDRATQRDYVLQYLPITLLESDIDKYSDLLERLYIWLRGRSVSNSI